MALGIVLVGHDPFDSKIWNRTVDEVLGYEIARFKPDANKPTKVAPTNNGKPSWVNSDWGKE